LVAWAGIAKLLECVGLVSLGFDRFLFADKLDGNQMAPNTAMAFVLLGGALVARGRSSRFAGASSDAMCLTVLSLAFSTLVGYLYSARGLCGLGTYYPMALHTAVLFGTMAIGTIMAPPHFGVYSLIASPGAGGAMARRLLPIAVAVPILLGLMRIGAQRAG